MNPLGITQAVCLGLLGGIVSNFAIKQHTSFLEGHEDLKYAIVEAGAKVELVKISQCDQHKPGFKWKDKAVITLCDYGLTANDKFLKHQAIHVLQWCSSGRTGDLKYYTHRNEGMVYEMAGRLGLAKELAVAMDYQHKGHSSSIDMGLHAEAHLLSNVFTSATLAKAIQFRC